MAKKAFIIGVNTYGLQYAENDAALMSECLKRHGYEIIVGKGKKIMIFEQFEKLLDNCNHTDTVIVYFSGHALIENGELQFVLDDSASKLSSKLNINNMIVKPFENCKRISHKLVILDCCNAGTSHARWSTDFLDRYYILTSSGRIEQTRELDELKAGFLTYYIHKGLLHFTSEFVDNDNKIRVVEFYAWLKKQAEHHNGIENSIKVSIPHLLGNAGANFDIAEITAPEVQPHASTKQTVSPPKTQCETSYFPDRQILTWLLRQQLMLTLLLISIIVGVLIWLRIPTVEESYDVTLYLLEEMVGAEILVDKSPAKKVNDDLRIVIIRVSKGSHRIDIKKGSNCVTVEQLIIDKNIELKNLIDKRSCLQS